MEAYWIAVIALALHVETLELNEQVGSFSMLFGMKMTELKDFG
jgi:hypothetical protein